MACSLTDSELRERRGGLLKKVGGAVLEVKEVEGGYAYRFPADDGSISDLASLINLERRCCPFLRFGFTVEPNGGPVWLELTGPEGTKEFLTALFN